MSNVSWMESRPICRQRAAMLLVVCQVAVVMAIGVRPAWGWFSFTTGAHDSALGSNSIVDIRYDAAHLWLATGKGLTRATLDGREFINFGSDVLNSGEISAVAVHSGEVWVAPTFSEVHSDQLVPYGAGFNITRDGGETWSSSTPSQASGAGKICYDLAFLNKDTSVWAACFYGGLIRSKNGGQTWENVFPSQAAATDFVNGTYSNLNNRFFSIVTDESNPDSQIVWAGSAGGVWKFVFFDPSLKLTGTYGQALLAAHDTVWLATEKGLSFSLDAGRTWRTFAENAGFPTPYVASVFVAADGIWAGVGSFVDTVGAGIMLSSDGGRHWQLHTPPQAVGAKRLVTDFASVNGATYAACGEGGLIHTTDDGDTWSADLPAGANAGAYYSLTTQKESSDTTFLWAGTDDYIYKFVFTTAWVPDTLMKYAFDLDTISLSNRVVVVEIQPLASGQKILWSLHQQTSPSHLDGFAYTPDGGQTWQRAIGSAKPFAIGFSDSLYYLGTELGVVRNLYGAPASNAVWLSTLDNVLGGDDDTTDVRSILASGDSIWVGSDVGVAISADSGATWSKVVSNPNPGVPDDTVHYYWLGDTTSISGNFITALAISRQSGVKRIWAATQQTSSSQINGVSVTSDYGSTWDAVLTNVLAWNFAFDGPKVYVATSQGLIRSADYGQHWDTISVFRQAAGGVDTAEIYAGTEVFSVFAQHDTVWVGTEDGLAISFDGGANWRVVRRFASLAEAKAPEPYATPVPWSPESRMTPGPVRFHYKPPVDGPVKITIYDFSNRKVVELTDGISRQKDVQYDNSHPWDGKNQKGETVAVGTYFFVIEYANGSAQWGKLVVLP